MPLIERSSYVPPRLFTNPHVQTIYPALLRQTWGVRYSRERIATPDEDFLDLDWSFVGSKRLAILTHGLEGHSGHSYMLGMAKALNQQGISALAWNLRGCSGEPNRKQHFYNGGQTEDLATVVSHVEDKFDEIYLVGFSLGGNLTLKYLGEQGKKLCPKIKSAVAFSVPVDFQSCATQVTARQNWIYFRKFMRTIEQKISAKSARVKLPVSLDRLKSVTSFKELDDWFTAPLFGLQNAEQLWKQSSCLEYLDQIGVPTLMVTAQDDPMLGPSCYPTEIASENPFLYLEMPQYGGHVGFVAFNRKGEYWSEARAIEFINAHREAA
ncbi:MAG: alpha/beta fold hydrolase [Myxococcota bacterium]